MAEVKKYGQLLQSLSGVSDSGRGMRPQDPLLDKLMSEQQKDSGLLKQALSEALAHIRHGPSWIPEDDPRIFLCKANDADATTGELVLRHGAGYILNRSVEIARVTNQTRDKKHLDFGSYRITAVDKGTTTIQFTSGAVVAGLRVWLTLYRPTVIPVGDVTQEEEFAFSGGQGPANDIPLVGPVDEGGTNVGTTRFDFFWNASREWSSDFTPGDGLAFPTVGVDSSAITKSDDEFTFVDGGKYSIEYQVSLGVDPTVTGVQGEVYVEKWDGTAWSILPGSTGYYAS